MTKQALIERLAEIEHQRSASWIPKKPTWAEMTDRQKAHAIKHVNCFLRPIIPFVADFILTECAKDIDAATCAQRWREAMQ